MSLEMEERFVDVGDVSVAGVGDGGDDFAFTARGWSGEGDWRLGEVRVLREGECLLGEEEFLFGVVGGDFEGVVFAEE